MPTAAPVAPGDKLSFDIALTDAEAKELFLRIFERCCAVTGPSHANIIKGAATRATMAVEALRSLV